MNRLLTKRHILTNFDVYSQFRHFTTKSAVKSPLSEKWLVEVDTNYGVLKPPKPISTETQNVLDELYLRFKFAQSNYFAKKSGFPFQETLVLFQKRANKFPAGILNEILFHLNEKRVKYEIIDRSAPIPPELKDIKIAADIFDQDLTLHNFQVEIANTALQSRRGIVKCATGGGKTVIFASILKALQNAGIGQPALLLFRNKSLVDQSFDVLQRCGVLNVGRLNMDHNTPDQITCATIQSMHKYPFDPTEVKTLIVDEVHEFTTKQSLEVIKELSQTVWRLGFSATPFKKDDLIHNYKLKSWFGPQLCDVTTEELQDKNILADSIAHFYPVTQPVIKGLPYAEAEEAGIHENEILDDMVVDLVNKIETGRILILVKRLSHGDRLAAKIPGSYWIKGEDDANTRESVLERLRYSKGKRVVAIFSPVGYVGLDVFIHHLINCCGGKDPNLTIQKVGRGLRKAPDKERIEYHDFVFKNNKYLMAHSKNRLETLQAEGHEVIMEPEIVVDSSNMFINN